MDLVEWLVVFAGVAAIALVNWYFFFAERSAAADSRRQPQEKRQ